MKEIAHGLRPYHLDRIGLSKTLEKLVAGIGNGCGIRITCDVDPIDDVIPGTSHIHIYRIVQETISNIVRHSQATRATVSIARRARAVEVRLEDNGRGFDAAAVGNGRGGLGLMSIRERTRILGGTFELLTRAHAGTTLVITLPLERRSDE